MYEVHLWRHAQCYSAIGHFNTDHDTFEVRTQTFILPTFADHNNSKLLYLLAYLQSQVYKVKIKVNVVPEQATKAQRGSRCIALLFL